MGAFCFVFLGGWGVYREGEERNGSFLCSNFLAEALVFIEHMCYYNFAIEHMSVLQEGIRC